MPIYEYRCRPCDEVFETLEPVRAGKERGAPCCPRCGGRDTERCWSRVTVETGSKGYHPAEPADV